VKKKQNRFGTSIREPNENISFPYGLAGAIKHYLDSIGILEYSDAFRECGIPVSRISASHTASGVSLTIILSV
jgi:hypothetical protein